MAEQDEEIVAELGMNASQVKSLRWVLICWLGQYGNNEGSALKNDIEAIHYALEEV